MRTIGLSFVLLLGAAAFAAAPTTPLSTLAELASDLSTADAPSVIAKFDPAIPHYGEISNNLQALIAQAEVSCSVEIISDTESVGIHKLDVDWLMTLKSLANNVTVERRREHVKLEMRQIKGKWKITAFEPLSVLDPIHI